MDLGGNSQKGISQIKQEISKVTILKYYDVTKEVTIQADASQYGLGAAILQDGQPIAYASSHDTCRKALRTNRNVFLFTSLATDSSILYVEKPISK